VVPPFAPVVERVHGSDVLVQVVPDLPGDVNEGMGKLKNESDQREGYEEKESSGASIRSWGVPRQLCHSEVKSAKGVDRLRKSGSLIR